MKKGRFICKLVLFSAVLALLLSLTAVAAAEETGCTATQHIGPIIEINRIPATCTANGSVQKKCSYCGVILATEPIIAQGHHIGEVTTTVKAPTCTEEGQKKTIKKCSVCGAEESTAYTPVPALGHDWGEWTTTKAATCEGTGTEKRVCKRGCGAYEERSTPALGHLWGTPVTTPATCIAPMTTTKTCQRDPSHKESSTSGSPDMQNGHVWGDWSAASKPTCMSPSKEIRICKLDSSHKQERTIGDVDMVNGHQWDNGTYITQPTTTHGGEIKYVCKLNSDHTKIVKVGPLSRGGNNTFCAFGPRLRDTNLYPYNTDAWYMFTPFDASKDGVQTYDLIATNKYIVGTLTLTIQNGNLKVDYTLKDPGNFTTTLEFFTVLNRINDLTDYEPENLKHLAMQKGEFINLANKFGDDTNLVLYFCSRCNYTYSNKISTLDYDSISNQRLLQSMLALMD